MRLFCAYYPKTRWVEGAYVLSKEISKFKPDFFSSPEGKEAIINQDLTGLASAQILALLFK
ncbi:MAG: hypothetical protein WAL30_04525 [Candidatus Aquirickettsiella sp.]